MTKCSLNPIARHLGHFWGSGSALSQLKSENEPSLSNQRNTTSDAPPSVPIDSQMGGKVIEKISQEEQERRRKIIVEKRWRDFFSDPSQWWDHRPEKGKVHYPDFKHKQTSEALWLDGKLNPPWVKAELAMMTPGTVKSHSFSWNTRLARLVKAGRYEKTIDLFREMLQHGFNPDKFTFPPVINACARLRALQDGRCLHLLIIQSGFESDVYVGTSLVDMYAKCRKIGDARSVFDKMATCNVVSWNAMILGYVKCGNGKEALELFRQMQYEGVEPVSVTFVGVLNACASLKSLEDGRHIHSQIIQSGYESDVYVGSSLIDMYAKCGSLEDAVRVFDKMPNRNVVCWNAMITAYAKCGVNWSFCDESNSK